MRTLGRILSVIILSLLYRIEIIGRENIPEKGPAILCANHKSLLDMFLLGYRIKRWIHWMAKEELFRIPILKSILVNYGAFPVKRGKGDIGSIKASLKILEDQHILGIFPEGTRVSKKKKGEYKVKSGVALIAVNAQVPIIPAAIVGNYKLFSPMKVIYGKPFYLDVDKNKKYSKEELQSISQDIMNKVYLLMEGH
ncbi:MAG TPA: 1-acyl-sn-glycerol-3-phosphate acyltransferase [Clostridiaceae bacterium]|nr:1-acyl-sn-glycerol-3-phosphate acyltransferase [Clostridiaceae bacterium]